MIKEIQLHKSHYSALAALATLFSIYFVFSYHSPQQLFLATLTFSTLYIIWGVWHHSKAHHLTPRIVLEYLLVAALGIVIVSTLLL